MSEASYNWTPPVVRFVPLLKELVAAGLLRQGDDGRWELSEAAQAELIGRLVVGAPERAPLAVGVACSACGSSGLTSMVDGRRLCVSCRRADAAAADAGSR
jgi:hypothetical protein